MELGDNSNTGERTAIQCLLAAVACTGVSRRGPTGAERQTVRSVSKEEHMLEPRDIAGVYYQLGPAQTVSADGSVTATGDAPDAQLMYSADGHYSFIVTPKRDRTSGTERPDLSDLPTDELRAAVNGVIVLAGRFAFCDGFLEHHVDFSLNPNLIGEKMVRNAYLGLDGADFTLAVPPGPDGSRRRVHWRRAPVTA